MASEVMELYRREMLDVAFTEEDSERSTHEFWESLKQKLDDELTPEELRRVLYLLKDKFTDDVFASQAIEDPRQLLDILGNNMLTEDALSVLQHVFSVMDIYPEYEERSFGQMIRELMTARKNYGCSNITGREREMNEACNLLKSSKGIWIHGMGGLGKTLLAREVCFRLYYPNWTIKLIDLKGAKSTTDMLRSILSKFKKHIPYTDLEGMTADLIYELKKIQHGTCVLLDNVDGVYDLNKEEVQHILHRLWDSPEYMPVKWIVTSRFPYERNLVGNVILYKLGPLTRESAEILLKQSCRPILLTELVCKTLLDMTREIPLAIRLISSALKTFPIESITENCLRELLGQQQYKATEECFQYSYRSLTEIEKYQLHMISVVETSQFDIKTVKAILDVGEMDAVFLMMKLTNKHILQSVNEQHIEERSEIPLSFLQYCLHPLIFEYISKIPMPVEYILQAQSNFCRHMIQMIEPCFANYDENYPEATRRVSSNFPLLKILIKLLSNRQEDIIGKSKSSRNIYLSKLHEMLQMTKQDKERLYSNLIEQTMLNDRPQENCFWEIERVHMMVDSKRFSDAGTLIRALEDKIIMIPDDDFGMYVRGRFLYNKGRFLRYKKEKQLNNAIKCFQDSLEIFQNTRFISDESMAHNAMGNAYFDQDDYDKALMCHKKALDILQKHVKDKMHPEVANYKFNVGTIHLAKARQQMNINSYMTEVAKDNFEKALEIFRESMELDEQMGTCRTSQHADKLTQRAQALFFLDRHEEAISDIKKSLKLKLALFESPDPNRTEAYFSCGRVFWEWRQSLRQRSGTELSRRLVVEATSFFQSAEEEQVNDGKACLTGHDKSLFIKLYRQIAIAIGEKKGKRIKAFCNRFERGVTVDSSSSSSSSSEPSPVHQHSDSDEGIDVDGEDIDEDKNNTEGIPSAQIQKQEANQFEQNFFADINAQLSSTESKKRRHSSSDLD